MTKSKHNKWLIEFGSKHRLFRKRGEKYDVLEFERYSYTEGHMKAVCVLIQENLTEDLLSNKIKKVYPPNHKRWNNSFFGYCVPATFALLYLMDTDDLEPVRGEDASGEGHWWLKDVHSKQKYDPTCEQFPTHKELEEVYLTGKPRGYFGFGEMPASRFLDLMQKVQPESKRWITDDYKETPTSS
jgi:hypothetical protein